MKNTNAWLVGSVVLILLAVALVAVLDKASTNTASSQDVRARASSKQLTALNLTGIVTAVDTTKGTVQVSNVQFADNSRAGAVQNLGAWTVTAPSGFNFASVSPGGKVTIAIDSSTFLMTSHTVTALSIVATK